MGNGRTYTITAGHDRAIKVWDPALYATGLQVFTGHLTAVHALAFSVRAQRLIR